LKSYGEGGIRTHE